ncbi:aminotransferase class I/II-fold pyridoxal phosphate-dependent enzyme [Enterococcus sp. LJL120]
MTDINTFLAQIGNHQDQSTGAISLPIHLSTTYEHPKLGQSTGYDYTRTKNPTRWVLEEALAKLENGSVAVATSSGMSALQLAFQYFPQGSRFLVCRDLYGGSFRFFEMLTQQGIASFEYFNNEEELAALVSADIAGIFIETPTNPLMQVLDIKKIASIAKANQALLIVDNTFLTPLRQKPLDLGADIVIHSGTKFLSGHNDLLAGVVVAKDQKIGEKLTWLANTTGPTLSPFDSWLFVRSLKTLALRFEKQEETAKELVKLLPQFSKIKEVIYPGVGSMISIRVTEAALVPEILANLQLFTFAESLGGVESLITYPTTQTHADVPKELREAYGLTADLLRLSIGIEGSQDLAADLKAVLD